MSKDSNNKWNNIQMMRQCFQMREQRTIDIKYNYNFK